MNNSGRSILTTKQPKTNSIETKNNKQTNKKKEHDNPVGIWQLAVSVDTHTRAQT